MSNLSKAVEGLVACVTTSGSLQDLQPGMNPVFRALTQATAGERDEALRRLTEILPQLHPVPAAKVACTCGAFVENGSDPHVSGPTIVPLLPHFLDWATQF